MEKLYIPILLGTTRQGRESEKVAKLVEKVGRQISEIEVELVDPRTLTLPFDGNNDEDRDPRFTEIVKRADGFIIVTPEYNYSFPGSLKRMLDAEFAHYFHKAVALMGVSNGQWGGVRAIEALVPTLRKRGLTISRIDTQFPFVPELFDEQGEIKDEAYIKRIQRAYDELIWLAKVLKRGREEEKENA